MVTPYARSWRLLLEYDENRLPGSPAHPTRPVAGLSPEQGNMQKMHIPFSDRPVDVIISVRYRVAPQNNQPRPLLAISRYLSWRMPDWWCREAKRIRIPFKPGFLVRCP